MTVRALGLVGMACATVGWACGPRAPTGGSGGATSDADDGSSSTAVGPGGSDAAGPTSGPDDGTADDTGDTPCPEGEYCFDVVDLPGRGSYFVAGDLDEDGRPEVFVGDARVLDWIDGELVVLGPVEPDLGPVRFYAPSPLDGVPQFYADVYEEGGAYRIEGGELVVREHPRPEYAQMPPWTGVGGFTGLLGPLDFDGDQQHDLLVYEDYTEYPVTPEFEVSDVAQTGHLLRFEGETPTVVGEPLPTHIVHWHDAGSLHMAAADFDGDLRDEIVVPDDLVIATNSNATDYDPRDNHLVTLRIGDDGYEELWRAPAGLFVYELTLHDLDGDGVLDLLAGGPQGVAVARGWGDGTFEDPTPLDLSPYQPQLEEPCCFRGVSGAKTGDLDGDGDLEVVVAIRPPGDEAPVAYDLVIVEDPLGRANVRELLVQGVSRGGYMIATSSDYSKLAVGDLDGNGCDDVVSSAEVGDDDDVTRALMFYR